MTVNWVTELVDYSENVFVLLLTNGFKYLAAFVGAACVSLMLTPVFRELARSAGMVDRPDKRRINTVPIPRGGGLSVFVSFHAVLGTLTLVLGGGVSNQFDLCWQAGFFAASTVLVVLGLIDDKRGMSPLVKLTGQIVVASILFFSNVHVGGIIVAFPRWLDYLVTVFWIVGAINAFNLIDGMDGLATGLALIASIGLAGALLFTGQSSATLPYLVLAGACLGFLRYNFHPASVFLGDTGSMFLGLCIATLPLVSGSRKELVASLGVPMLAMGIPIFDTMLAIWRRSVRALLPKSLGTANASVRVMQPDKDHLHHRILRETLNQRTAAITLYLISAALVAVGLLGTLLKGRAPGLFLIAFVVAIYVVVRHLERVELWDTGRLLLHKRSTIRKGVLMPLHIIADVLTLCAVWMVARWIVGLSLARSALLSDLPVFVVPVFVSLVLTKTYWRVWSRAQVRDFALLGGAVLTGTVIGVGLVGLLNRQEPRQFEFAALFCSLAIFPLVGMRLWQDCVRGVTQALERLVLLDKPETLRLLAYGGGVRFRSYLREMTEHSGYNDRVIIGIVDDDIALKGRIIAGHTVFWGGDELGSWVIKNRIDGVVITCLMEPKKQAAIAERLGDMGLLVSVWDCEEREVVSSV